MCLVGGLKHTNDMCQLVAPEQRHTNFFPTHWGLSRIEKPPLDGKSKLLKSFSIDPHNVFSNNEEKQKHAALCLLSTLNTFAVVKCPLFCLLTTVMPACACLSVRVCIPPYFMSSYVCVSTGLQRSIGKQSRVCSAHVPCSHYH